MLATIFLNPNREGIIFSTLTLIPTLTMNNTYYISKYNFYIVEDNQYYIYNTISGCIVKLSHRLYSYIEGNDDRQMINANGMSNKLISMLLCNHIIYSQEHEESAYLEYQQKRDMHDDSFLSMVMLPTLKCNLRCHYCYEKDKNISLSEDALNTLKLFFDNQSKHRKYIAIRWSGGEILTYWSQIKELSKSIIESCQKNNCVYISSAISNGSLLTSAIVDEMVECNIKSLQITLDGDEVHHNRVRYYKDGKGTFKQILNSIAIASQRLKVIVRINLDKHNYPSIENLFKTLSSTNINRSNIQIFCKPVLCTAVRTPINDIFTPEEFYNVELALLQLSQKYELPYSFHWGIKGHHTRCAYSGIQGFYVTPNMKLYKCPVYLDQGAEQDNSVGYIDKNGEMIIYNYSELLKSLSYSPFDNEECIKCKVLPICHGKCPIFWENSERSNDAGCIPEKYSIVEKVKYAIRSKLQMNAYNNSGII